MPPLKLLHVFGTFDLGGTEARTLGLMAAFGAEATHSVLVSDRAAMAAADGVPVHVRVDFPEVGSEMVSGRPTPRRLLRLARLMRGHDLVLTYAWGAMDAVVAHRLFARVLGLPALVHHEDGLDPPRKGLALLGREGWRRLALKGPDRIVVPSLSLRDHALARWGAPPDRLATIANGIALGDVANRAEALPIPGVARREGETLVCAVAGLRPEKNLPRLVRAAAKAGGDIRVAIIGEGREREAIRAEARRMGCADRVDLAGFLADARRRVGSADIFALSSDTEQCPLSLIEAMAAGLPVVATRVGDIEHMVARENLPFLVEADDEGGLSRTIRRLADDPPLRQAIGTANAAKARREHGADRMVAAYRQLYRDLACPSA